MWRGFHKLGSDTVFATIASAAPPAATNDASNSSSPAGLLCGIDGNKFALVCDDLIDLTLCAEILEKAETVGYEDALLNTGAVRQEVGEINRQSRRGKRAIVHDEELAKLIWSSVQSMVPDSDTVPGPRYKGWRACGVNPCLRILKYDPDDYFELHQDGSYTITLSSDVEVDAEAQDKRPRRSFLTLQCYLNTGGGQDFTGGATRFYKDMQRLKKMAEAAGGGEKAEENEKEADKGDNISSPPLRDESVEDVVPRAGRVLMFQHNIWHCGERVAEGTKLVLRSEIMYSEEPETTSATSTSTAPQLNVKSPSSSLLTRVHVAVLLLVLLLSHHCINAAQPGGSFKVHRCNPLQICLRRAFSVLLPSLMQWNDKKVFEKTMWDPAPHFPYKWNGLYFDFGKNEEKEARAERRRFMKGYEAHTAEVVRREKAEVRAAAAAQEVLTALREAVTQQHDDTRTNPKLARVLNSVSRRLCRSKTKLSIYRHVLTAVESEAALDSSSAFGASDHVVAELRSLLATRMAPLQARLRDREAAFQSRADYFREAGIEYAAGHARRVANLAAGDDEDKSLRSEYVKIEHNVDDEGVVKAVGADADGTGGGADDNSDSVENDVAVDVETSIVTQEVDTFRFNIDVSQIREVRERKGSFVLSQDGVDENDATSLVQERLIFDESLMDSLEDAEIIETESSITIRKVLTPQQVRKHLAPPRMPEDNMELMASFKKQITEFMQENSLLREAGLPEGDPRALISKLRREYLWYKLCHVTDSLTNGLLFPVYTWKVCCFVYSKYGEHDDDVNIAASLVGLSFFAAVVTIRHNVCYVCTILLNRLKARKFFQDFVACYRANPGSLLLPLASVCSYSLWHLYLRDDPDEDSLFL